MGALGLILGLFTVGYILGVWTGGMVFRQRQGVYEDAAIGISTRIDRRRR
jgi:hypothetical protein